MKSFKSYLSEVWMNSISKSSKEASVTSNQKYTGDKSHWPAEKAAKSQAKYKKSMQMLAAKLGIKEEELPK